MRCPMAASLTLRFDGHSLSIPQLSITNTSKVEHDLGNNTLHITEGGTVTTHPVGDRSDTRVGKLIYDDMSTVLSSSAKIGSYRFKTDDKGKCSYSFEIPCDRKGVSLTWAMDDVYSKALSRTKAVLGDYKGAMAAKSKAMNDLLNYQIPYFRCSDKDIVNVYYYLWSIYLMYYIDVQQGWEMYPHTQSAVNNFLGMHRYDANFQILVGAWTADKDYYAYGNVLHWKAILPYARRGGGLPDNKGIAWISPVWGTTTEHVIGAWKIYQRTGDVKFLHDCYDDYFKVLFKNGIHAHWGCNYDAAEYLRKMAILTGDSEDPDRWLEVVNMKGRDSWLNNMWESRVPKYFGGGETLGWSGFAYLRNSYFPEDWAYQMVEEWALDSEKGFFWKVPLSTTAKKDFDRISKDFSSTPDTNYYALLGMYKSNVGRNANICALAHLKKYNMNWGIPIAPEAWSIEPEPWGDQYSNFNAGKIQVIIEGMGGLEYSIPDSTFTVSDCMPEEWSYMQWRVPIKIDGKMYWPTVDVSRKEKNGKVIKTVLVKGNPMKNLQIRPWLEEGKATKATAGYVTEGQGRNRIGYNFTDGDHMSVSIEIEK